MMIQTKIQRWGNGLALRLGGALREIPHFKEGMPVKIEVTEEGITVKKLLPNTSLFPYSEVEILNNLTFDTAHGDLLATPLSFEVDTNE